MGNIAKISIMVVSIVISVAVLIILLYAGFKMFSEQRKLHSSIQLVQLKSFKLHYLIFLGVSAALFLYLIGQTLDKASPECKFFIGLGFERWQFIALSAAFLVMMAAMIFFFIVCAFGKSAVVDKGIFTGYAFISWIDIYDYVLDEKTHKVIFTVNREAFSTMRGTTPPFKVATEDISKLLFILNKNKNRFS